MPYTIGLHAAVAALLHGGLLMQFTSAVVILLFIYVVATSRESYKPTDAPVSLPGSSLFYIYPFFRRKFDFLNWGFRVTGEKAFQFKLLNNTVIAVSGESARQTFLTTKRLDLTEGFKLLSGAIPMVPGVTSDLQTKRIALIHKRLAAVQREESLSNLISPILEDSRRIMEGWGGSGAFDPFEKVYELFFQITVRSLSCTEIADDAALVARLKTLYDQLDEGTTPLSVLLPWLPTPGMVKKLKATKQIYDIVNRAIDTRLTNGGVVGDAAGRQRDTLQMLLDEGDERLVLVGFIMGLLIAGARATGTTACWLFMLLGSHPEWRAMAKAEVEGLLAAAGYAFISETAETSTPFDSPSVTFSDSVHSSSSTLESLSHVLSSIPLTTWESSTPVLTAIVTETLRLAQPHTAMRKNLGPETFIDGVRVPSGAYVVYPFADVHLDPDVYDEPGRWNPGRWLEDIDNSKEKEKGDKGKFGYIGWGAGKTTCLGTRLAKVELKLVLAMLLIGFEHWTVPAPNNVHARMYRNSKAQTAGLDSPPLKQRKASLTPVPVPDFNDALHCKPSNGPFNVRYQRTGVPL